MVFGLSPLLLLCKAPEMESPKNTTVWETRLLHRAVLMRPPDGICLKLHQTSRCGLKALTAKPVDCPQEALGNRAKMAAGIPLQGAGNAMAFQKLVDFAGAIPVSYTHLTLPTILLV